MPGFVEIELEPKNSIRMLARGPDGISLGLERGMVDLYLSNYWLSSVLTLHDCANGIALYSNSQSTTVLRKISLVPCGAFYKVNYSLQSVSLDVYSLIDLGKSSFEELTDKIRRIDAKKSLMEKAAEGKSKSTIVANTIGYHFLHRSSYTTSVDYRDVPGSEIASFHESLFEVMNSIESKGVLFRKWEEYYKSISFFFAVDSNEIFAKLGVDLVPQ